jgi:GNAT superfamily N-acetyltransferase
MINLRTECKPTILSAENLIVNFNCGDDDLNEFFNHKALHFKEQLLAQTNFFRHNETGKVVCAFSLSPNALKTDELPGSRRKKVKEYIPREKSLQSYPAFLVGRLGVALEFSRQGIGSQLIDYIRSYCLTTYPDFS